MNWFIVSSGAGFRGVRIRVRARTGGDMRIASARLVALPFYNGQVTAMTAFARQEWPAPSASLDDVFVFEAPEFEVPGPSPQSRRQVILILSLDISTGAGGEAELAPEIEVLHVAAPTPRLPALHLVARDPAWTPVASGDAPTASALDAIHRLNAPSCVSHIAILPGDGAPSRLMFRKLFERVLDSLVKAPPIRARILTQKHMSQTSFSVSKNDRSLELSVLRGDRVWDRLFDEATDYHTVSVELFSSGAIFPQAGAFMQASLRDDGVPRAPQQTLTGGVWNIDHPNVHTALAIDSTAIPSAFTDWIRAASPLQGWAQSAAWIPEFDIYDAYHQTLYEQASRTDWFRAGLNGELTLRAWLDSHLRAIAPVMWLDQSLLAGIDLAALDRAAMHTAFGAIVEIRLRDGVPLTELERVFASRLPLVATAGASTQ